MVIGKVREGDTPEVENKMGTDGKRRKRIGTVREKWGSELEDEGKGGKGVKAR